MSAFEMARRSARTEITDFANFLIKKQEFGEDLHGAHVIGSMLFTLETIAARMGWKELSRRISGHLLGLPVDAKLNSTDHV